MSVAETVSYASTWNDCGIIQMPYHKYEKYSEACLSNVKIRWQSKYEERLRGIKTRHLLTEAGIIEQS